MHRLQALRVLSLSGEPDEAAIRDAYAKAVRAAHPDTGSAGGDMAATLRKCKAARDALLRGLSDKITTCTSCQGVGIVRNVRCPFCNGRGTR